MVLFFVTTDGDKLDTTIIIMPVGPELMSFSH